MSETCGQAFSESGKLNVHMRTHSGEKPYVCDTCGKAFPATSLRTCGRIRESGRMSARRPHVCVTCGKGFCESTSLAVHMRTHSGQGVPAELRPDKAHADTYDRVCVNLINNYRNMAHGNTTGARNRPPASILGRARVLTKRWCSEKFSAPGVFSVN